MCHFVSLNRQIFAKWSVWPHRGRVPLRNVLYPGGCCFPAVDLVGWLPLLWSFRTVSSLEVEAYTVSLGDLGCIVSLESNLYGPGESQFIIIDLNCRHNRPGAANDAQLAPASRQHQQDQSVCHPTVSGNVGQTKGRLWRRKGGLTLLHYQSPVNHDSTTKRRSKQLHKQNPWQQPGCHTR